MIEDYDFKPLCPTKHFPEENSLTTEKQFKKPTLCFVTGHEHCNVQ